MTNDGVVALEKCDERDAVILGRAAAPHARDEALELVVTPGAAAEGELSCIDDIDAPVEEGSCD